MVFESSEVVPETPATDLISYILDTCPYNPDKPILVDAQFPEQSLSWTQIRNFVRKSAAGFSAFGVEKSDCVMFFCEDSIHYYPLAYACIGAGAIFSGGSAKGTTNEIKNLASAADAKYFVVEPTVLNRVLEAVEALSLPKSNIIIKDATSDVLEFICEQGTFKTWKWLMQHGTRDWERIELIDAAKDTIGMRFFTSGTSGVPKAVDVSHYGLVAHVTPWDNLFQNPQYEIKMLRYIGLSGVTGHGLVTTAMKLGYAVYLLQKFSIDRLLEACSRLKPSVLMLDPGTATKLTKALPADSQELRSIRDVRATGLAFPSDTREKLKTLLHLECLVSRPYGLTEVGTITALSPHHTQHDPNSVGFTWPGVRIKLIDDDGNEITAYDASGEICVQSPTMFSRYHKDPSATAAAFDEDSWFHTSDTGYISATTGQWYLQGRKKDIFNVDFREVSPVEIESLLVEHPDILDAVVVPIRVGEVVDPKLKACVVLRDGSKVTTEEIIEFVSGKLEAHMRITGGVEFIDSVPRNATGKIVRWKVI